MQLSTDMFWHVRTHILAQPLLCVCAQNIMHRTENQVAGCHGPLSYSLILLLFLKGNVPGTLGVLGTLMIVTLLSRESVQHLTIGGDQLYLHRHLAQCMSRTGQTGVVSADDCFHAVQHALV